MPDTIEKTLTHRLKFHDYVLLISARSRHVQIQTGLRSGLLKKIPSLNRVLTRRRRLSMKVTSLL
jgi:hypothetical protein